MEWDKKQIWGFNSKITCRKFEFSLSEISESQNLFFYPPKNPQKSNLRMAFTKLIPTAASSCRASRAGNGTAPGTEGRFIACHKAGTRAGGSAPLCLAHVCLGHCIVPGGRLVFSCHPDSLPRPENISSQIQVKLNMCV